MKKQYVSHSHNKHLLQYHIVWSPKFRFHVLKGKIEQECKNILLKICKQYGYQCIEIEVMPDHIHLFLSLKPTVAPSDAVRTLKSITAVQLFKTFPHLKKFYARCGSLWGEGYFITTVGHTNAETVQKYIQEQKTKAR
jgi:putative transposase